MTGRVRGTRPKTQPWFQNTNSSTHVSSRRNTVWGGCTARGAQGAPPAVPTHALAYFRGRAASPPRGPANKEKHRQRNSTGREGAKRVLDKARMRVSRKDNLLPNVTSRLGVPAARPRHGLGEGQPGARGRRPCGSRKGQGTCSESTARPAGAHRPGGSCPELHVLPTGRGREHGPTRCRGVGGTATACGADAAAGKPHPGPLPGLRGRGRAMLSLLLRCRLPDTSRLRTAVRLRNSPCLPSILAPTVLGPAGLPRGGFSQGQREPGRHTGCGTDRFPAASSRLSRTRALQAPQPSWALPDFRVWKWGQ